MERWERTITAFHQDPVGDWVATFQCGHTQHMRHRPPWEERPWVATPEGRAERLAQKLPCGSCGQLLAALGPEARERVRGLDLLPHPEGGFYRETYRASVSVDTKGGPRAASTAIYFLIPRGSFSAFHRIRSDEVWHFYGGAPLEVICLHEGARTVLRLGTNAERGEEPQGVVLAGTWFASRIDPAADASYDYAWVGCTVAPGFDFADFEMAERDALSKAFPAFVADIKALTR